MHTNSGQGDKFLSDWFAEFSPSFGFDRGRLGFYNILGPVIKPSTFSVGRSYPTANPFQSAGTATVMPPLTNILIFQGTPGPMGPPGGAGEPGSPGQDGTNGQDGVGGGGGGSGSTPPPKVHPAEVTAVTPLGEGGYSYDVNVAVGSGTVPVTGLTVPFDNSWRSTFPDQAVNPFQAGQTVLVTGDPGDPSSIQLASRELPRVGCQVVP